jgi:2',3'-cyclic-nucleotide 2'-phosphodiesterase/3'-nucleotidase/5'-nucleotidase
MKRATTKMAAFAVVTSLVSALYGPQAFAAEAQKTVKQKTDIELAVEKGAIVGYPGSSDLREQQAVTRAELVSMINRAAKLQNVTMKKAPFTDLEEWQMQAVSNASAAGIVHGNGLGHFEPNRAVTREELAVIVVGALTGGKKPEVNENVLNYFKDSDKISSWARPYVAHAVIAGLFQPTLDGNFDPQGAVTRAEAAKALKPILFTKIDILTTNDIHGKIEVGFDKNRNQAQGGMATIAGIINDFRAVNKGGTVVVDGGDAWQGTLISNMVNGKSVVDTMGEIEYDAAAIGNHEFDFGRDVLIENIKYAKFPIMGANIIDDKTGKRVEWAQPYTIVEKNGLKIGIIGFATPQTESTTKADNIEGLSFPEPTELAKQLSKELREKGCDLVIVTSHLPGENDAKTKEIVGELVDLANGTGNGTLDAIVGGHSHQRVAGIVNGIPVVEAHQWTWAIGHIELYVDKETKKVVSSGASLLETYTNLTTADNDVAQIVKEYKDKVSVLENEVQGKAAEKLTRDSFRGTVDAAGKPARDGVTPLGNLITDAMRADTGADIAFTNIGGIRADVDAGDITYGEMFAVLPFGNVNVTGTMTAEQIKRALEAVDKYSKLPALQFSGIKVEWDNNRPEGDKFTKITLLDGTPVYVDGKFNTERTFKVTTNDFMMFGGDGYKVFGEVKDWRMGGSMLDSWIKVVKEKAAKGEAIKAENDGRDIRLDVQK